MSEVHQPEAPSPRPGRAGVRSWGRWATLGPAVVVALSVAFPAETASAGDIAEEEPDAALELARRHAPIVMLKAQEEPCDADGEPYAPTSVDIVLDNPQIVLRQLGPGDPVVQVGPGASDLFGLGEGFHVDFPGSALEPGCLYETDFRTYTEGRPAVVYAHVVQQEGHPDRLAVQYWFYWYYNDWNNKHESDWEFIQLLFDASSATEALATDPVSIGYAQHEGGERADWDSAKLEREGSHPVVYPSAGSHASYYDSALYLGRSGSEGFGCDNTDGPSVRVEPEIVLLPDAVDDPDDPLAWLGFGGRWGERRAGPFNGPTGPTAKGRWLEPIDWAEDLRESSVIVPTGDRQTGLVISVFCGTVEWGSGLLISLTTSPLRLLLTATILFFVLSWAARRTIWDPVEPTPLRRRRRAGQIMRLSVAGYRWMPRAVVMFGLAYIPAALAVVVLAAVISVIPVIDDIAGLAGRASGSSVVLALLAGSLPHVVALFFVTAMTAVYLDRADGDVRPDPVEVVRYVWSRRRDLLAGLARAAVIVVALYITVIGAPLGAWFLVRYQLAAPAIVLEGLDGRRGLARSAELVRGRWWHTAVVVAVANGLLFLIALLVGVVLLVIFSGLPLWLFSGLIALVFVFVAPLAAVVTTLLYGDAVAESADADRPEPALA